nr:hypothetical protein [Lachnospiraceae bacterium]
YMSIATLTLNNYIMVAGLMGLWVMLESNVHLKKRTIAVTRIVILLIFAEAVFWAIERWTREKVYRIGGDEYAIFYLGRSEKEVRKDIENMRRELSQTPYNCAFGYEMVKNGDIHSAMLAADREMYTNKAKIKDSNERKIAAHKEATIRVMHEALKSGMWGMEFDDNGNMISVEWSQEFNDKKTAGL